MKLTTLVVLVMLAILGGCGQSGPLYIPGEPSSVSPPPAQNDDDQDDQEQQNPGQ